MTKWKEQFDKQFLNASAVRPTKEEIQNFISTQIIEKLIEDIPDAIEQSYSEGATAGADGVHVELNLKQELRKKWL